MIEIVEQAKQPKLNAPPVGSDDAKIVYPGVNTCVTVTFVPDKDSHPLAGLHLGLYMGVTSPTGVAPMIPAKRLTNYLQCLLETAGGSDAKVSKIYVAGALAVWKEQASEQWGVLKLWLKNLNCAILYKQFNDDTAKTVNVTVIRAGVSFTATAGGAAVGVDEEFEP